LHKATLHRIVFHKNFRKHPYRNKHKYSYKHTIKDKLSIKLRCHIRRSYITKQHNRKRNIKHILISLFRKMVIYNTQLFNNATQYHNKKNRYRSIQTINKTIHFLSPILKTSKTYPKSHFIFLLINHSNTPIINSLSYFLKSSQQFINSCANSAIYNINLHTPHLHQKIYHNKLNKIFLSIYK
jgi:hypothetical protein